MRTMVPADLFLLEQVVDCDVHPTSDAIAYSVAGLDEAADVARSRIWMCDRLHGTRALTSGPNDTAPKYSPDGKWLAFLSAKGGRPQLKVLPLHGGEAITLTAADDGVAEQTWLPDSSGLLYTAPVRPDHQQSKTAEELAKQPEPRRIDTTQYRFNGRGWIHDRRRHVFSVAIPAAVATAAPMPLLGPTPLTGGPWDDSSPVASPDGSRVAFLSARHRDREWVGGNDVWVAELRGPSRRLPRALSMTNGGRWQCVRWLDDRYVLSLGFVHRKVGLASWHVIDTVGGEPPRRIGDGEVTCGGLLYGRPHAVVSNGGLFTHGVRRGAVHIDRYEIATGARETIVGGPRSIGSFALRGRTIVFVAAETNKLAELYERPSLRSGAAIDARERVLTNVAEPFTATVRLATLEEFETVASDGYPVHGFVCRPPGSRRAAKRTPGLLFVHGGPLSQYGWGFFDEFQLAAAAGYTVVGVNPRGSDGYGHNHADAITGDFGNLDWIDVQAAIEWLAKQPDVDPERLGIGGGSYGGFMTAWATARNHRFKVALVERAVINWSTMEATSDIGWFQQLEMGATTLTDPIRVARQSPITYVKDVRTPTLIVHSEEDWRCPIEQGEQWFVSLRRLGVPCEFVRFPGENHELTRTGRPSLRIARLRIVHEWFAKYLGGTKF